ncbi:MAG: hypothetical protein IKQ60_01970 [Candidatus Methanomethylophilaceae archaeon]|nr:hypothetical protein [Candidatus Methanomethylophilaceae archaeon]
MGVDSDFITKPQVYHILKVLKDQEEEAILSGRRRGLSDFEIRKDIGLNKEKIYEKVQGSKQTKVFYMKELQKNGFVEVESVKDLEKKGLIDNESVKKGEWNSKKVTILDPGKDLLEKLEVLKNSCRSDNADSVTIMDETDNRQPFSDTDFENCCTTYMTRYEFGNRLVIHRLEIIKESLEEPDCCSAHELNRAIDSIYEIIEGIDDQLRPEFRNSLNSFKSRLFDYKGYDIPPESKAILIDKLVSNLMEELKGVDIDGEQLLNSKISGISDKLKKELQPGVYEELKKNLDDIQDYVRILTGCRSPKARPGATPDFDGNIVCYLFLY